MEPSKQQLQIDQCAHKIRQQLINEIELFLNAKKISQTDFGRILGVSKGAMSQLMNHPTDLKISRISEICLAMGKMPVLTFVDIPAYALNLEGSSYDIESLLEI